MKRLKFLLLLFYIAPFSFAFSQTLELEWVVEHPCYLPSGLEYDRVLVDDDDNVFLVGANPSDNNPFGYGAAIMTRKYDSLGNFLWESKFDNMYGDKMNDAMLDSQGQVLVAGHRGALPGSDPERAELFKYDSENGGELWRTFIFDTLTEAASLSAIALDSAENIYGVGVYNATITEYDSNKMFLAKIISETGEASWIKIFNEEFSAKKITVLEDRIRVYGGQHLGPFDFRNFIMDLDFSGQIIDKAFVEERLYGPGIFNSYFFFEHEGYFVSYGYVVCKDEVSEEPYWCFEFDEGISNVVGQANAAFVDEYGNVYATGYFRDTITLEESTRTVKLTPEGELIWGANDKLSEESTLERGLGITASEHHVFVSSIISYYDENGIPLSDDYRILLYSSENGNLVHDTLININVRDIPYHVTYHQGNFYLLGKSYDSSGCQFQVFKFNVEEPSNTAYELLEIKNIQIFPNPTFGKVNISQNENVVFKNMDVYDLDGNFVMSKKLANPNMEFDFSNLIEGIYLLKFKGENRQEYSQKMVVGRK